MPVYEYACTECGERLEVRQSFTDEPLTVCPACAGKLRKVLSPVGVVFKGSGFYRTDSRAKESSGAKASSNGSDTTASSGSSGSTESTTTSKDKSTSSGAAPASPSKGGGSAGAKAAS